MHYFLKGDTNGLITEADVYNDVRITAADARLILRIAAGLK